MRTDTALRHEAMDALVQALGTVDAERFISMIKQDTFDYTEWRRDLFKDMTIEEVYEEAAATTKKKNNTVSGSKRESGIFIFIFIFFN